MRLLAPDRRAVASTRAPLRPLVAGSTGAAARVVARVRAGSPGPGARRRGAALLTRAPTRALPRSARPETRRLNKCAAHDAPGARRDPVGRRLPPDLPDVAINAVEMVALFTRGGRGI